MAQANAKDMISILSEEEFDLVNVRQSPTITSPLTIIMESLPTRRILRLWHIFCQGRQKTCRRMWSGRFFPVQFGRADFTTISVNV